MKSKNYIFNGWLLTAFCLFLFSSAWAQTGTVSGTVTDVDGPVISATVLVSGTTTGTITDFDGNYSLELAPGNYNLEVSYIGYTTSTNNVTVAANDNTVADFALQEGVLIGEVVVLGTRAANRTNVNSAVPVDVIDIAKLGKAAPQTDLNQILTYAVPSFSSNTQTISDGTDHIDPASLRGLGPDQVLVLMNGKRRHNTSLVNINGTFGRGNVGTDLNAIPSSALSNVQVLRDGAAAQYGSDAIAGVINLELNKSVNELAVSLTTGANFTASDNIGAFEGEQKSIDGEKVTLGINYGLPLGDKGGFINLTGEFDARGATNRMKEFSAQIFNAYNSVENVASANGGDVSNLSFNDVQTYGAQVGHFSSELKNAISSATTMEDLQTALNVDVTEAELNARGQQRSDYNMRVGQSENRGGKFFANMEIPLAEGTKLYSFGGMSYRNGTSGCFYRLPHQSRTTTSIYLDGTVPKINSNIKDQSISTGIKGNVGDWGIDLSNTYGSNDFQYFISESHNATLGVSSPTAQNAGGHKFVQNTTNFDVSQYFDNGLGFLGVNVAFGAEYRYENYLINPGTEQSYGNYDKYGILINSQTADEDKVTDFFGRVRPSGSQCFAGFLPTNAVDAQRSAVAGYADFEFDVSEDFLISTAARFEDYSDFGSTFNWKVAGRYSLTDNINVRAATSTGFRAPSLHQINFSRTSTIFELVNGVSVAQEVGIFSNTSRAAKLLGIPELSEETSQSLSIGVTATIPNLNMRVTVDAYQVDIDDRVILTGRFTAGEDAELQSIFANAGADAAAFFANAIDTRSQGIDMVVSHTARISDNVRLTNDLALTLSKTELDRDGEGNPIIHASELLERKGLVSTYLDQQGIIYVEKAVPRTKVTLSHSLSIDKMTVYLRNTFFGEVTEATNTDLATVDGVYPGKLITDLSVGYNFTDNLSLTVGANNLLDVYPKESDESFQSSGRFIYSRRSPQFSVNGRHVFARLAFTLK